MIAASIVSHGHGTMVAGLVEQVLACPEVGQVIVTLNVPEEAPVFADRRVEVVVNRVPQGFGANHNAAFRRCREPFWCVLNPDIELSINPFPALLDILGRDSVSAVAPLVRHPRGKPRRQHSPLSDDHGAGREADGRDRSPYALVPGDPPFYPEWVGGMFMLFRASTFASLQGFDEGYYLYYEDVEHLLARMAYGYKVVACPSVSVIHDARRASRGQLANTVAGIWQACCVS